MNICMQFLIYAVVSKSDRAELRAHWRERRQEFIRRHIIDDDPYDDLTQQLRERDKNERENDAAE